MASEKLRKVQNDAVSRAKRQILQADLTDMPQARSSAENAINEAAYWLSVEDASTLARRKKLLDKKRR